MSAQAESFRFFAARRPAPPPPAAHVAVVASGKGGTGSSVTAVLLAAIAARAGASTLLVDAQETPASLSLLMGGLAAGAADEDGVRAVLPNLHLAAPARDVSGAFPDAGPAMSPQGAAQRRVLYRRLIPRFGEYQCVIVDAGSRLDDIVAAATSGAGRVLMVSTVDRVALAATHALLKVFASHGSMPQAELLANRCDLGTGAAAFAALRAGAQRFLRLQVTFAAAMPDDERLSRAVEEGRLLQLLDEQSAAVTALEPVALHLMAPPLRVAGLALLS